MSELHAPTTDRPQTAAAEADALAGAEAGRSTGAPLDVDAAIARDAGVSAATAPATKEAKAAAAREATDSATEAAPETTPGHSVSAPGEGTPRFNALQLDLEVFNGPFDLLLELVMREEIDLLEVDLAQIVLGYVEILETRGEIELEPVTEFVVLVAALLELKSRLMLPRDDDELGIDLDLGPEEAAEELLARMLEYHRYNRLAGWLRERYQAELPFRYRSAPPPRRLRTVSYEHVGRVYDADLLARSIGDLLREPEPLATPHMRVSRVTLEQRLGYVRDLLKRARHFDFDEAVAGADRLTEALTLWALLELYKIGEADWDQPEAFGPIEVFAPAAGAAA